jgi:hypothetical protein
MADFISDEQLAKDFTAAILSRPNLFTKENLEGIAKTSVILYNHILAALKADKPQPGESKAIHSLHSKD